MLLLESNDPRLQAFASSPTPLLDIGESLTTYWGCILQKGPGVVGVGMEPGRSYKMCPPTFPTLGCLSGELFNMSVSLQMVLEPESK